ncbi:hypothetical protein [Schaedlerella arabinosiphila]|uniref:hypothetical protein n=1 Tax=Schaedlerella arabinosiphila TaxID=2044587 RepID=UPI002688993C
MENVFKTGNPTVDRMGCMQLTGYVIPVSWYRTIRKPNGRSNLAAVLILADIVYWYRAVEVRDEMAGGLSSGKSSRRILCKEVVRSWQISLA